MANKALTMLQIRRILKLMMEECSQREIHRSTGIHRVTLKNYLNHFKSSGKTFSELFVLSDHDLSVLVHPPHSTKDSDTKQVLWEEYVQDRPVGYQYSQFCYYLDQ